MEVLAGLGVVGAVLAGIIAFVLIVLIVLMPFFVYGTNMRTRQTALTLLKTNKLLQEIRDELRGKHAGAVRGAVEAEKDV